MRLMRRTFIAACACAALAACSGNPLDGLLPPKGSCNAPALHSCTDYTGSAWSVPSSGSRACTAVGNGAAYASTACAAASRVGSCIVNHGGTDEIVVRLYPPLTLATAQAACATMSGSTFVAN